MYKLLLITSLLITSLFAQEKEQSIEEVNKADCLILEDENSIICKYILKRSTETQDIIVQWIDPQGDVSRSRDMTVPAGHGSIYDYRYIKGRISGLWTFKVISDGKEYQTQFELKALN